VDGNPLVLLFDISSVSYNLSKYKQELFGKSGIRLPDNDTESNDCVLFGFMVAQFIADFNHFANKEVEISPKIVCHFHEWLSGNGLIMI